MLIAKIERNRSTAHNFIKVYRAFPEISHANLARLDSIFSLEFDRCKHKILRMSIDRMVDRSFSVVVIIDMC